uniref:Uncharacterized protein n=1 Tax=Glossina palpalis gambiensis TaxID=67801 RepID=A0A1B0AWS2_9MUSC
MDPDCFAMSSYQFVNSLASCYPQQMNSQQNHPSANANTPSSNGPPAAGSAGSANSGAATPGNDYFPVAAAYTPNLYPNTPQSHYANQAAYKSVARSLNKGVLGVNLNNNTHSNNVNVNVPLHSPGDGETDSESDSGNEAGSSQNSGNKKNPPQIYPWMKRWMFLQMPFFDTSVGVLLNTASSVVPEWE